YLLQHPCPGLLYQRLLQRINHPIHVALLHKAIIFGILPTAKGFILHSYARATTSTIKSQRPDITCCTCCNSVCTNSDKTCSRKISSWNNSRLIIYDLHSTTDIEHCPATNSLRGRQRIKKRELSSCL